MPPILPVLAGLLLCPAGTLADAPSGSPPGRAAERPPAASSDAGAEEQTAAALAARAEAGATDAMVALIPLLEHPESRIRHHAHWGLVRAGEPAVEPLLHALRVREDDEGRARLVRVLGGIGLGATTAVPELRAALAEPDSATAVQAATALGHMRAHEAVPDLVRAYAASRRTTHQRHVARALREIGSEQALRRARSTLLDAVLDDLAREAPEAAAAAYAAALYRAARDDRDYAFPAPPELHRLVPPLRAALDAADPALRAEAVRALGLAGRDAGEAVAALGALLHDPDLQGEARRALVAIATPEAEALLARRRSEEALEKRVREDFDLSDHQGRTWLLPFRVAGDAAEGLQLSARFLYPGRHPQPPSHVIIGLESTSAQPRLADARRLTWLADGTPVAMTGLEGSWSRGRNGGVIERVSGRLALRDFLRIANAQALSARIGAVAFTIAEPDRLALRHFASRIPAPAPAAPGP